MRIIKMECYLFNRVVLRTKWAFLVMVSSVIMITIADIIVSFCQFILCSSRLDICLSSNNYSSYSLLWSLYPFSYSVSKLMVWLLIKILLFWQSKANFTFSKRLEDAAKNLIMAKVSLSICEVFFFFSSFLSFIYLFLLLLSSPISSSTMSFFLLLLLSKMVLNPSLAKYRVSSWLWILKEENIVMMTLNVRWRHALLHGSPMGYVGLQNYEINQPIHLVSKLRIQILSKWSLPLLLSSTSRSWVSFRLTSLTCWEYYNCH